ncbi:RNA-directed DNA polymerase, eukaryota, reverse transcriptase zinc-binding domain protein [Tanacetum coccineum]
MDSVTASMCKMGIGRVGFARVLVEVSASKAFPDEIDVVYKNGLKEEICRKSVKVVYDWKPYNCSKCCVFGHSTVKCGSNSEVQYNEPVVNKKERANGESSGQGVQNKKVDSDGFIAVQRKKSVGTNEKVLRPNFKPITQPPKGGNKKQGIINGKTSSHFEYQPKQKADCTSLKTSGKQDDEMKNRDKVEKFISLKKDPSESEIKSWNADIVAYYKQRKKQVSHNMKDQTNDDMIGGKEVDDVFEDDSGCWNIKGLSTIDKQDEVRDFLRNESLSLSNLQICDKGCRIMIGWNSGNVVLNVVHSSKQSVLCEVAVVIGNTKMFCSFVYAANEGKERRLLWEDLQIYKRIVGNMPWTMMGDMNVTLKTNEHL